jgi:hypothetical protein
MYEGHIVEGWPAEISEDNLVAASCERRSYRAGDRSLTMSRGQIHVGTIEKSSKNPNFPA